MTSPTSSRRTATTPDGRPTIVRDVTDIPEGRLDRLARRVVLAALERISDGRLVVVDDDGTHRFGPASSADQLAATVTINHSSAWRLIATGGSSGLGEAHRLGLFDVDDLTALIQLAIRNSGRLDEIRNRMHRVTAPALDRVRRRIPPSRRVDKRNVSAHYDLSNELFSRFLDETMTYSAAVFEDAEDDLFTAQITKLDRLCRKLDLGPTDRLVEIGTGWGALAMHAASQYGCRVVTTTLSAEQHELATGRVKAAGLDHLIEVRLDDYRNLTGTFDAAVSVEMIEAVDWRNHETYFAKVADLLTPQGRFAMQAITMADRRYDRAKVTTDFIKSHIFPGGCLPSVTALTGAATAASDLRMTDLEDLGPHYAETLRRWRDRFAKTDVTDLDLDESFRRMWDFYLCYCEGAFNERHVSVVQAVFVRDGWRAARLTSREV